MEHRNYRVVYRRYASLFFLMGIDEEEVRVPVWGSLVSNKGKRHGGWEKQRLLGAERAAACCSLQAKRHAAAQPEGPSASSPATILLFLTTTYKQVTPVCSPIPPLDPFHPHHTEQNELGVLELIHCLVETLDKWFSNVCELDIMFSLDTTHHIIDEMIANGCCVETNKANALTPVQLLERVA